MLTVQHGVPPVITNTTLLLYTPDTGLHQIFDCINSITMDYQIKKIVAKNYYNYMTISAWLPCDS